MAVNPTLIRPQAWFLALQQMFRAYVGGYGSGKTWGGCAAICKMVWQHPRVPLGYFAPTYTQVRDIFYPTIAEVAQDWGLRTVVRRGAHEVDIFSGQTYRSTVICRSMKDPESIVGFKIGRGLVDEIDTLNPKNAAAAWRKIIARRRFKFDGPGGIDVTTTPEGFKFTWKQWEKGPRDNKKIAHLYGIIHASTYENEANLRADYIPSLLDSYPPNYVNAYINGEFGNLEQGTIYVNYDRELNRSTETIQPGDILRIGMDFNIGKMAAIVHVNREVKCGDKTETYPHAVDEIINAFDTPDMIRQIKERYWPYEDGQYQQAAHQIWIYPDTTGKSRTRMGAGINDIQLLREAGFKISAPQGSPPVKDRIISVNAGFCNANGERRYFVNVQKCPTFAECLEQQAYNDQGEPDKKHDQDHPNDAAGYFYHQDYPLRRPVTNLKLRMAM